MSRSSRQRTSPRPPSRRRSASTDISGGAFFLVVLVPSVAAALACFVTVLFAGPTTTPLTLRQELAMPAAGRGEAPAHLEADEQMPAQQSLARLFTPEVLYWEERILEWAREWGLDPNLVATVMQIESCGDPFALSRSGAMGLFQVMPYHFAASEQPYDPSTNARRGLAYLSESLSTHEAIRLALAGYNGGIRTAGRAEFTWPAETVRYAYWGSGIYADALAGEEKSVRLAEWLEAGGASLCAQAAERLGLVP